MHEALDQPLAGTLPTVRTKCAQMVLEPEQLADNQTLASPCTSSLNNIDTPYVLLQNSFLFTVPKSLAVGKLIFDIQASGSWIKSYECTTG